jgi:(1->4)-alpha-D-glucan 1-alpha-D-glucosylmutase
VRLGAAWGDTALPLPAGDWRNVFTGALVSGETGIAELAAGFPVVLLERLTEEP